MTEQRWLAMALAILLMATGGVLAACDAKVDVDGEAGDDDDDGDDDDSSISRGDDDDEVEYETVTEEFLVNGGFETGMEGWGGEWESAILIDSGHLSDTCAGLGEPSALPKAVDEWIGQQVDLPETILGGRVSFFYLQTIYNGAEGVVEAVIADEDCDKTLIPLDRWTQEDGSFDGWEKTTVALARIDVQDLAGQTVCLKFFMDSVSEEGMAYASLIDDVSLALSFEKPVEDEVL
ncbi:MAG: hypothetical protein H6684_01310 [Deltaproteobacteria bacterium]|nr:hypothetical protein [bacterium]MCB9476836.1 hypothetical protein [Deltaproteobacteria bacterium]MCB9487349.1 hypothetical protein [Deltaproteobacteria bacterium]